MRDIKFRADFTKQAEEIYQHAMWKAWKFKTFTQLDSWLAYGWSMLFKRPITQIDINTLKSFLKKRRHVELKKKYNRPLTFGERSFMQEQWIGRDGFIYMTKMIPVPPIKNMKEHLRLEALLREARTKNGY